MNINIKRGFTLIELLVVIAILAILATVTVVVLNPAELLRQARDSTRISELGSLRSALALYLASQNASLGGTANMRCSSATATSGSCAVTSTAAAAGAVNGNGWVDVNLTLIPGGSPLATLPIDPVNNATNFYRYQASSTNVFELNANMESARYNAGTDNVEVVAADGGDQDTCYEVGTNVNLITIACP